MNTEIEQLVTTRYYEKDNFETLYIDVEEVSPGEIAPRVFSQKGTLEDKNDEIINDIKTFIMKLSDENYKANDEKFQLKYDDKKKNHSVILHGMNFIATDGRIGSPNTFLLSQKNYDNHNIEDLEKEYDLDVIIDDKIEDLYMYRKNNFDQPGLLYIYNDKKDKLYDIGFFPYKQFMKIKIK